MSEKIVLIGNDEGPKRLTVSNLFRVPVKPLTSGVSLDIYSLKTEAINYQFWCVDSHELDNIRTPDHYFKDCVHVLIVPKDHEDLIKITEYLTECFPEKIIRVLIPSFARIKPLHCYYHLPLTFILSKMTRKNATALTNAECKQFIETVFKNQIDITENKDRIIAFTQTSFFRNRRLNKDLRTSLLKDYVIPALFCLRA